VLLQQTSGDEAESTFEQPLQHSSAPISLSSLQLLSRTKTLLPRPLSLLLLPSCTFERDW
jgi:hypothetical protein